MKLKSIKIEGMNNVLEKEYIFNDVNYLYGPNGAGKSTVLQAIQLALLGYIPGTAKINTAIYRHARTRAMSVEAKLEDNGQVITITRTFTGSTSSAKSDLVINPDSYDISTILGELELPVFNFDEFTNLSANKMKEWFISFLPESTEKVNLQNELAGATHTMSWPGIKDMIKAEVDEWRQDDATDLQKIKNFNAKMKENISFEKGSIARLTGTAQSLIYYNDVQPGDDVTDIQAKIDELSKLYKELTVYESVKRTIEMSRAQLIVPETKADSVEADPDYIECDTKIKKYNEEMNNLQKDNNVKMSIIAELTADIKAKQNVINGKGICPYTAAQCDSIVNMIDNLKEEVAEMADKAAELSKVIGSNTTRIEEIRRLCADMITNKSKIVNLYTTKLSIQAQLAKLPEVGLCPTTKTSPEITSEINDLQNRLVKLEANSKYEELSDKLTAEKFEAELRLEVYKKWEKLTAPAGELQAKLSEKPFRDMENDMTEYLKKTFGSDDVKMKFNLSEKANTFSFGIERSDKYIPFDLLSSGEKCLYTFALMICLTLRSNSKLKLILVDDLLDHLDDDKAAALFKSLYNVKDIQLILAGVKACTDKNLSKMIIEVK